MQLLCQRLVALQVLGGLPCGCLGILQLFAEPCEVVLGQDCNTGTILGSVADVLGRAVEIAGQVGWLCVWINLCVLEGRWKGGRHESGAALGQSLIWKPLR